MENSQTTNNKKFSSNQNFAYKHNIQKNTNNADQSPRTIKNQRSLSNQQKDPFLKYASSVLQFGLDQDDKFSAVQVFQESQLINPRQSLLQKFEKMKEQRRQDSIKVSSTNSQHFSKPPIHQANMKKRNNLQNLQTQILKGIQSLNNFLIKHRKKSLQRLHQNKLNSQLYPQSFIDILIHSSTQLLQRQENNYGIKDNFYDQKEGRISNYFQKESSKNKSLDQIQLKVKKQCFQKIKSQCFTNYKFKQNRFKQSILILQQESPQVSYKSSPFTKRSSSQKNMNYFSISDAHPIKYSYLKNQKYQGSQQIVGTLTYKVLSILQECFFQIKKTYKSIKKASNFAGSSFQKGQRMYKALQKIIIKNKFTHLKQYSYDPIKYDSNILTLSKSTQKRPSSKLKIHHFVTAKKNMVTTGQDRKINIKKLYSQQTEQQYYHRNYQHTHQLKEREISSQIIQNFDFNQLKSKDLISGLSYDNFQNHHQANNNQSYLNQNQNRNFIENNKASSSILNANDKKMNFNNKLKKKNLFITANNNHSKFQKIDSNIQLNQNPTHSERQDSNRQTFSQAQTINSKKSFQSQYQLTSGTKILQNSLSDKRINKYHTKHHSSKNINNWNDQDNLSSNPYTSGQEEIPTQKIIGNKKVAPSTHKINSNKQIVERNQYNPSSIQKINHKKNDSDRGSNYINGSSSSSNFVKQKISVSPTLPLLFESKSLQNKQSRRYLIVRTNLYELPLIPETSSFNRQELQRMVKYYHMIPDPDIGVLKNSSLFEKTKNSNIFYEKGDFQDSFSNQKQVQSLIKQSQKIRELIASYNDVKKVKQQGLVSPKNASFTEKHKQTQIDSYYRKISSNKNIKNKNKYNYQEQITNRIQNYYNLGVSNEQKKVTKQSKNNKIEHHICNYQVNSKEKFQQNQMLKRNKSEPSIYQNYNQRNLVKPSFDSIKFPQKKQSFIVIQPTQSVLKTYNYQQQKQIYSHMNKYQQPNRTNSYQNRNELKNRPKPIFFNSNMIFNNQKTKQGSQAQQAQFLHGQSSKLSQNSNNSKNKHKLKIKKQGINGLIIKNSHKNIQTNNHDLKINQQYYQHINSNKNGIINNKVGTQRNLIRNKLKQSKSLSPSIHITPKNNLPIHNSMPQQINNPSNQIKISHQNTQNNNIDNHGLVKTKSFYHTGNAGINKIQQNLNINLPNDLNTIPSGPITIRPPSNSILIQTQTHHNVNNFNVIQQSPRVSGMGQTPVIHNTFINQQTNPSNVFTPTNSNFSNNNFVIRTPSILSPSPHGQNSSITKVVKFGSRNPSPSMSPSSMSFKQFSNQNKLLINQFNKQGSTQKLLDDSKQSNRPSSILSTHSKQSKQKHNRTRINISPSSNIPSSVQQQKIISLAHRNPNSISKPQNLFGKNKKIITQANSPRYITGGNREGINSQKQQINNQNIGLLGLGGKYVSTSNNMITDRYLIKNGSINNRNEEQRISVQSNRNNYKNVKSPESVNNSNRSNSYYNKKGINVIMTSLSPQTNQPANFQNMNQHLSPKNYIQTDNYVPSSQKIHVINRNSSSKSINQDKMFLNVIKK